MGQGTLQGQKAHANAAGAELPDGAAASRVFHRFSAWQNTRNLNGSDSQLHA
jgi:hypothetical protein